MVPKSLFQLSVLIVLLLFAAGCQPKANLPNPASVHCEESGGTLEIREEESGGQVGYCVFEDGSECEEWVFFRGECQPGDNVDDQIGLPNPASVYCEENDGMIEMRVDELGGQVGFCLFSDGSVCEEWAFYRGACVPGDQKSE